MKQSSRPIEVAIAVALSAVACTAGFAYLIAKRGAAVGLGSLVVWCVCASIVAWYLASIWRGRRWAWRTQMFFGAYGLITGPWRLAHVPPASTFWLYVSQLALCAVATLLLVLPRARAWFRPNNSSKPTPLRGAA